MRQQSKVHLYYLIILLLFVFSGYFIPSRWFDNAYFELFFSQVGLLLIPTAVFLLLSRHYSSEYLPLKRITLRDVLFMPFLVIPLIFMGSFLNALMVFLISSWHGPIYAPLYSVDTALPLMPYVLGMALLPGILEETVHRGILLGTYRHQGNRFAIVTSALMFSLLHLSLANLSNTFMLGLFFGWLVIATGSLYSSMFAHFLYNLVILFSEFFVDMEELPEYLSVSFTELLSMVPFSLLCGLIWWGIFRQYKKGHPKVPLESRRQALQSFGRLFLTDRLFAMCFLFVLVINGVLLFF